jgi:N-acyl-D-amino-acid deacylase
MSARTSRPGRRPATPATEPSPESPAAGITARPALDVVIRNATIHDGSGRVAYHGDVGIANGRVAAIGALSEATAGRVVDATGLCLCPGFVDAHSHAEMTLVRPDHPDVLEPLVRQGITTFVGGNCGTSMAPVCDSHRGDLLTFWDFFLGAPQDDVVRWRTFGEMLSVIEGQGMLLNAAVLAPQGILRLAETGLGNVPASRADMDRMKGQLADCLDAGAIGMSSGLQYFPGLATDQAELTELARVVHDRGGVFTAHLRSYNSDTLAQALDEVFAIGRDAEVPVQISHLFCVPRTPWPLDRISHHLLNLAARAYRARPLFDPPLDFMLRPFLERIRRRIAAGQRVGVDAMPTAAGFTHLLAFLPPWALDGGVAGVLAHLKDPASRREMRRSIEKGDAKWPHRGRDSWSMNFFQVMGWDAVHVMSVKSEKNRHAMGRSIASLAKDAGKHPFDVAADLLIEEQGRVLVFETPTWPGDDFVELSLKAVLADPNVSIVTDTILLGFGLPSHLFYDAYPKFLGKYVREKGLLPLAEAIRKCTSLPAEQLGLGNRGRVRVGWPADLVLFDADRIGSRSTPDQPARFPEGIHTVFVNGHAVVDPEGYHPEPRSGQLIRRGG